MIHLLFHFCDSTYADLIDDEVYKPTSLQNEGFIHLSKKEQLSETLNTHFKNKPNITCLRLEIPDTDPKLVFDFVAVRREEMPHYYGALPTEYIKGQMDLVELNESF